MLSVLQRITFHFLNTQIKKLIYHLDVDLLIFAYHVRIFVSRAKIL